jgi:ABC-type bacteriocin/lantibiotic exporter with double-glycine peptidase domain
MWTYALVLLLIPVTGIACVGIGWLILKWRQRRAERRDAEDWAKEGDQFA